ncbi:MAG: enoyl-CoA hydratase/isomerase family protein [Marinobacter sp.]|uniref:enoyl-CoA hydratase/isomerase family protein n=1 Tax=unclassified Marinobacter TaxID=83889 RepID=UPI00273C8435|nr:MULTISPECIES: enoyl-CoA hydratase/isomerase family protein [unclassified Marinobacter]MDP4547767.1 enoyl-CoA hydratase/isomerase family protein [Marinobacter sp. MDS2]
MPLLSLRRDNRVAIISMDNGNNANNLVFAQQFMALLKQVIDDPTYKALILTSSDEKNWSQGIDVNWLLGSIQSGNKDDVRTFLSTMDEIYRVMLQYPMPIIAAINGHTFGNGVVIAAACDFRFMRGDRGYVCFPEVDMNIPFLPGLIDVILKAMPRHTFNEMMLTGRRVTADTLADARFIDRTFDSVEALNDGALEFAQTFKKGRAIVAEHKRRLHKPVLDALAAKNPPLIEALDILL